MGEGTRWRRLAWGRSCKALLSENYRQTTSGKVVVDPRLLTIAVYGTVMVPGTEYQAFRLPSGKTEACNSAQGQWRFDMITGKINYLIKDCVVYDNVEFVEDEYGNMVPNPDFSTAYGVTIIRDTKSSPWRIMGESKVIITTETTPPTAVEVPFDDEDFPAGVDVPTAIAG